MALDSPPAETPRDSSVPAPDEIKRDTVYYYSREHRLSRSSATVQSMNEENSGGRSPRRGFFANKANMMVFGSIIIICIMMGISRVAVQKNRSVKIGGNAVAVYIYPEDSALMLRITKEAPKSGEFYTGPVDISVVQAGPETKDSGTGDDPPAFSHRVVFRPNDSETYLAALPFSGNDFFVILTAADERKSLRVRLK